MKRTYGAPEGKINTKLRKDDVVQVCCGRDKGKTGKILFIDRDKGRVIVEKVNLVKKTQRPSQNQPQGAIVEIEASIHISNVMLVDPKLGKPTRVGFKIEDGAKLRLARKSKKTL